MKPWDSRLARLLILPLRTTRVHPNHITTVGLITGLAAAGCYARGVADTADMGGVLFLLSAILDHADGELARLTAKVSAFGHAYDRAADLTVKLSLFTAMGVGLRHGPLGGWAVLAGFAAGVALITIFTLRGALAQRQGPSALAQPSFAGFEIEDILYLIAPVTWLGGLGPFVLAAGIGAPIFALWVVHQYLRAGRPAAAVARKAKAGHPPASPA
jgi:archaetidylinositol phosphate synthase